MPRSPSRSRPWSSASARLPTSCGSDPDVVSVASFVGAGTVNPTVNTGRLYINLKPRDQRKASAGEIIDRLREATRLGRRAFRSSCRRCRMCRSTAASAAPNTNTRCRTPTRPNCRNGRPSCWTRCATCPELTDVASDQQSGGLQVNVDVDREKASRLNVLPQAIDDTLYDAFGQRQVSTIFTQLNQYRVVLEVEPQFPAHPGVARTRFTSNPPPARWCR